MSSFCHCIVPNQQISKWRVKTVTFPNALFHANDPNVAPVSRQQKAGMSLFVAPFIPSSMQSVCHPLNSQGSGWKHLFDERFDACHFA